jgi:hypothetical protein
MTVHIVQGSHEEDLAAAPSSDAPEGRWKRHIKSRFAILIAIATAVAALIVTFSGDSRLSAGLLESNEKRLLLSPHRSGHALHHPLDNDSRKRGSKMAADTTSPRVLNVHVVPHTHDDVGWLKTVEQYYFGWNETIQRKACVQDILDTVVSSLLENESRTFTYVESKFFNMWWARQSDAIRDAVRYLIANHQLSFVNGGWCMHGKN